MPLILPANRISVLLRPAAESSSIGINALSAILIREAGAVANPSLRSLVSELKSHFALTEVDSKLAAGKLLRADPWMYDCVLLLNTAGALGTKTMKWVLNRWPEGDAMVEQVPKSHQRSLGSTSEHRLDGKQESAVETTTQKAFVNGDPRPRALDIAVCVHDTEGSMTDADLAAKVTNLATSRDIAMY